MKHVGNSATLLKWLLVVASLLGVGVGFCSFFCWCPHCWWWVMGMSRRFRGKYSRLPSSQVALQFLWSRFEYVKILNHPIFPMLMRVVTLSDEVSLIALCTEFHLLFLYFYLTFIRFLRWHLTLRTDVLVLGSHPVLNSTPGELNMILCRGLWLWRRMK